MYSPAGIFIRWRIGIVLYIEGAYLSFRIGTIHDWEPIWNKPIPSANLHKYIKDVVEALSTQMITKACEAGGIERWVIYDEANMPIKKPGKLWSSSRKGIFIQIVDFQLTFY